MEAGQGLAARLAVLEAAADWPGIVAIFEAEAGAAPDAGAVLAFVNAALALGDPQRIAAATLAAIRAELPRQRRVLAARRLAGAGHGAEALATLFADPDILRDDGVLTPMGPTLTVVARALDHPALKLATETAWRRFANLAEPEPRPSPFGFAAAPHLAAGGAPGASFAVFHAGGRMAAEAAEFARLDAQFRATLAQDRAPWVRVWEDVFVNDMGQIWRPDRRLLRTHRWPLLRRSRAAMATAPRLAEAVFAFNEAFNFFHWYAEWLPALAWLPEQRDPPIALLEPPRAPGFVQESLDLAFARPPPRVTVGDAVFVERLYMVPAGAPWLTRLGAYRPLLDRIAAAADADAARAPGPRRIYLSRRGSAARPMANEAEVEAALAARGYATVRLEEMPLLRQVALLRGAEAVVAPHGAGLAHLLTARPGLAVFELMPVTPAWHAPRFCMARLSRIVGHRHALWLEPAFGAEERWRVEIPPMLEALARFEAGARG
ncbi:glycosyltransferase family 61 protein [Roseomonas sp. PWR1]|uniref:Glycosyltransferase family 61 protein n=1 Tax=Roseomonas nitratireducens TaxID=2820810 RepID=A0ABS4AM07_9PROT|nr:glycosyltransferase family 61 protein [Neoroseomonas nitratireducens]MBP0462384.1 glycosyltransferase family 61 protein [Neoroseomonas nitratireducens]